MSNKEQSNKSSLDELPENSYLKAWIRVQSINLNSESYPMIDFGALIQLN